MANPTGAIAVAGDIAKTGIYESWKRGVKGTTSIAKGSLVSFDTNGYVKNMAATDSIAAGFACAMESVDNSSGNDNDLTCQLAVGNSWVYMTAGGAIKPHSLVKINGTAATVIAHAKPANATTPTAGEVDAARDYYGVTVGRYMGHELEEANATDAANNDTIIVRLGL